MPFVFYLDINECDNGPHCCQQDCYNYSGGYECACYAGYRLSTDGCGCDGKQKHLAGLLQVNQQCCSPQPCSTARDTHGAGSSNSGFLYFVNLLSLLTAKWAVLTLIALSYSNLYTSLAQLKGSNGAFGHTVFKSGYLKASWSRSDSINSQKSFYVQAQRPILPIIFTQEI